MRMSAPIEDVPEVTPTDLVIQLGGDPPLSLPQLGGDPPLSLPAETPAMVPPTVHAEKHSSGGASIDRAGGRRPASTLTTNDGEK
jgi:hypothetical protein